MQRIPLTRILPNPEQPRRRFDEDALAELAQSIKARGVIQAITVEEAGDNYIIHDGERRWRASRMAGVADIPAVITPSLNGSGTQDRLVRALVANVQRADLNPIETAQALRRLQTENSWSHKKLSEETGIPLATIPKLLRLLELDDEIQELIIHGDLPKDDRVAKAMLSIKSTEVRIRFAQRMARKGVTINAIEAAVERLNERIVLAAAPVAPVAEREPAVRMVADSAPTPTKVESWATVRETAAAICANCDVNPGAPEPAWSLILDAAGQTCKVCSVRDLRSFDICRQCPAVELLKKLVTQ
jgi:ParB family transcriptional regulator, chromosome partitioning protein